MNVKETEDQQKMRFQIELEFVQCLANPNYLNFLAQRGFFKDSSFCNYLAYLQYWKKPEYGKFIKYPMCLYFLELLQYEHFRREIANGQCAKFIEDQQILHWQHYTRKRSRLLQQPQDTKDLPAGAVVQMSPAASAPQTPGTAVGAVVSSGGNPLLAGTAHPPPPPPVSAAGSASATATAGSASTSSHSGVHIKQEIR